MLLCPVRDCRQPLERERKRRFCSNGHSFDIARSGYTNLLQPQDRRSKQPGDTAAAVAARRRLHDRGFTQPLFEGIAELIRAAREDTLLDAGCGEGFYAGSLQAQTNCKAYGIDISLVAVDAAARRYPGCEWVVANADRFVPFADCSSTVVLSITARMNVPEFRRVLTENGRLLVALPGADDLVELRGESRDRVARTLETFAPQFKLVRQERVSTKADLSPESVQDVLLSVYRPRPVPPETGLRVTFSLDLLLFGVR